MKHVYELINTLGTVEYVGETDNPPRRFKRHLSKQGKFRGRLDLHMHIVNSFATKKEAYAFQNELQKAWGLQPDNERMARIGSANPRTNFTEEQVREIRSRYVKGKGAELGREFGVHRIVIGRIATGKSFKYLD